MLRYYSSILFSVNALADLEQWLEQIEANRSLQESNRSLLYTGEKVDWLRASHVLIKRLQTGATPLQRTFCIPACLEAKNKLSTILCIRDNFVYFIIIVHISVLRYESLIWKTLNRTDRPSVYHSK